MKTSNKHTRKHINPSFILLLFTVALALALIASLIVNKGTLKKLDETISLLDQANRAIRQSNELADSAIAELNELKEQNKQVVTEDDTTAQEPCDVFEAKVTAYCSCPKCCGIWSKDHPSRQGTDYEQHTTSGTVPTAGRTIAVDPDVIPLGSKVVLNGHEYIAEDTGSGVKGNHIDIYFDSHEAALDWGVKTMEVQVFEG